METDYRGSAQPPVPSSTTIRVPINADWMRVMDSGLFQYVSYAYAFLLTSSTS